MSGPGTGPRPGDLDTAADENRQEERTRPGRTREAKAWRMANIPEKQRPGERLTDNYV